MLGDRRIGVRFPARCKGLKPAQPPTQLDIEMISLEVKHLGREADQPPSSIVEFKKAWS
jgi:hypothetical protein